jgi:glyoxylase-like metal-dependent hydrolase (beta-lactamase superfamily II)
VDLRGGRYTPLDLTFSASLTFHQGEREVRVLELGVGHSESDVVVHLPAEKIVFCGDVFLNGMPQLPGRGHVTQTMANTRAIEALEAEIYVAGHGEPGTLADVRAARSRMESDFQRVKRDSSFLSGRRGHGAQRAPAVAGLSARRRVRGVPLSDFGARLVRGVRPEVSGRLGHTSGADTLGFPALPPYVGGVEVKRDWAEAVAGAGVVESGERACRASSGDRGCGR